MIAQSLEFVVKQLDEFLIRKSSSGKSLVKLSGLVTPERGLSTTQDNSLVLSLVNITEEGSLANQPNNIRSRSEILKRPPPIYLNVFLLISALYKDDHYADGLHWLSMAINFFQHRPTFNSHQFSMPEGLEKLSFELVNLDIDSMSRFWGALGAKYQPSVIYKMHMLTNSSESIEARLPELTKPEVTSGIR